MLTPAQSRTLASLLGPDQAVTDPAQLITYEFDAGAQPGVPDGVVLPHSTEEVQRVVRWAREQGVPVTARGSGTGYTGGAVTPQGGLVVSLARMRQVQVDEASQQATVQPGVISDDLNRWLAPRGLAYPPDPASRAVCTLGGTIAENAGGPHCLKYGVTSNYILGLEVVLADSRTLYLGSKALDPPEYDLAGLVTGSEGTLAIVTAAILRLRPPTQEVKALTASFPSVTAAGKAVSGVIAAGLTPATLELLDGNLIGIIEGYLHAGLPSQAGAMLIMDLDGYPEGLDAQMDDIVQVLERFHPIEIKVARTPEERERLWLARRSAGPALGRASPNEYGLDVSVPRSKLAETMAAITEIGERYGLRVTIFGHAGDGNLHPSLLHDLGKEGEASRVHRASHEILWLCAALGGSIAAEHGVGIEKCAYLPAMIPPPELRAMMEVKQVFDPEGLLNPGKIFPATEQASAGDPTDRKGPPPDSLPAAHFRPETPAEAAEGLRALQAAGVPTFVAGGQSKWREDRLDGTLLSGCGLSGIRSISADDLYTTALAGTPLTTLQAELAERGLRVPLANPWPTATVGGVVASNTNGPLRLLYGGVRDLVLAVQVALPDGRLLRFGRPLVKDVAGYEMRKLFVGSYGTLGLLTEVSLKVVPLSLGRRSLVVSAPGLAEGLAWALAAWRQSTCCSGLVLLPGPPSPLSLNLRDETKMRPPPREYTLVFSADGHPADVAAQVQRTRQVLLSAGAGQAIEGDLDATAQWERVVAGGAFVLRAAVAPRDLPNLVAEVKTDLATQPFVLDIPGGSLYLVGREPVLAQQEAMLATVRVPASKLGGYALQAAGPRAWLTVLDPAPQAQATHRQVRPKPMAWGPTPASLELMQRLKARWDPAGILNPGEFIAGQEHENLAQGE